MFPPLLTNLLQRGEWRPVDKRALLLRQSGIEFFSQPSPFLSPVPFQAAPTLPAAQRSSLPADAYPAAQLAPLRVAPWNLLLSHPILQLLAIATKS